MPASKNLSSIKVFGSPTAIPKIEVPEATSTHFYTAGRILTYFPQINKNGFTFLKEDTSPLADTLLSSTVDIQHVKKGYGVTDALVAGQDNATIGAISKVLAHDDGIDICVKIERDVARAFGFGPSDFHPGTGLLSSYSQECDFDKSLSEYIVVDKDDPKKIVRTISYADGQALGLEISKVEDGAWNYSLVEGNPVYMAVKPISFSGVGHVHRPADPSALVTKLVSAGGAPMISFYPGMDGENAPAADMAKPYMVGEYSGNDLTQYTQDFVVHPDLISAEAAPGVADGQFSAKPVPERYYNDHDADDAEAPDDHYAVSYSLSDFDNVKDGKPTNNKVRMFRLKSKDGEFDRLRCIAAYHAIMGMRGNIGAAQNLPHNVRQHALARVRSGLNATKPKTKTKELSSHMETPNEIEVLTARIAEVRKARNLSIEDIMKMLSTHDELTTAVAAKDEALAARVTEVEKLTSEIAELKTTIKEHTDAKVSTDRFSALDKILAFKDEEKADEKHVEFVKSLATLSETDFRVLSLERELVAEKARKVTVPERVLSSFPVSNPVPPFNGEADKVTALTGADLY